MPRLFRLLLILSLAWCALGIGEPAAAHDDTPAQHQIVGSDHAQESPGDAPPETPTAPEPGGHHHCPVAPGLPLIAAATVSVPVALPRIAARVPVLASLSRAPPLQPPAA